MLLCPLGPRSAVFPAIPTFRVFPLPGHIALKLISVVHAEITHRLEVMGAVN
jgi:hypothetical protein